MSQLLDSFTNSLETLFGCMLLAGQAALNVLLF